MNKNMILRLLFGLWGVFKFLFAVYMVNLEEGLAEMLMFPPKVKQLRVVK